MELHSYAKHKVAKKWTVEQKRKLIEARLKYDDLFCSKPKTSMAPWKKILALAKLDDFNVFFVRKQWSNMIGRYLQHKKKYLGNAPSRVLDRETIRKVTQDWEFFEPLHNYMTEKSASLHSYALTTPNNLRTIKKKEKDEDPEMVDQQSQELNSPHDHFNIFSSESNEEFVTVNVSTENQTFNTDHDSYTKKSVFLNYFADVSDDTQESILIPLETIPKTMNSASGVAANGHHPPLDVEKQPEANTEPATTSKNNKPDGSVEKPKLSERDKYYRHKRRFNHRLERRFDAILNVFGQIVKAEYPNIDVSAISGLVESTGGPLVQKLFSSDDEQDDFTDMSSDDVEMEPKVQAEQQPTIDASKKQPSEEKEHPPRG